MVNLISSESDDSDDEGNDVDHECCRDGLYVSQSRLYEENGGRANFLGLFTKNKIKAGSFIGFYAGEWFTERRYNRLAAKGRALRDKYAISCSSGLIISPPIGRDKRPDFRKFPISMANEPSLYGAANAILREYTFNFDEIEDGIEDERFDEDFYAVGLVACRDIGSNREILWHYGAAYPRPYSVGKKCRVPANEEDPISLFEHIPLSAVPAHIVS